jgi:hypothetical protein
MIKLAVFLGAILSGTFSLILQKPAEPLVPGPSRLEVEVVSAKLKKCKSPGSDEIPAELIQAGGEILLSAIQKLINSV